MTTHRRIIASLSRITSPEVADQLTSLITFNVRRLTRGIALSGFDQGIYITIDQSWLNTEGDDKLDYVLAHEIATIANDNGGEGAKYEIAKVANENGGKDVKLAIRNFAAFKAHYVPKFARDEYNRAVDAEVEMQIAEMRAKPKAMHPTNFVTDVRRKLWWLSRRDAVQITDAVLAEPLIDRNSPTLEDDIRARLPKLKGVSESKVMQDLMRMFAPA